MNSVMDQWVARLQNLDEVNIHTIVESGQESVPWMPVVPSEVVRELVIDELNLRAQVESVTAQIQLWGRLTAKAKRVWDLADRKYRNWRSKHYIDTFAPPEDDSDLKEGWTKTAKGDPKPPTEKSWEAMYRSDPEYHRLQADIERAEEAYNSAMGILEAFRAQRDMLRAYAYSRREDGQVSLSV